MITIRTIAAIPIHSPLPLFLGAAEVVSTGFGDGSIFYSLILRRGQTFAIKLVAVICIHDQSLLLLRKLVK